MRIRWVLLAALVVTGTLLAARALVGPLKFPVAMNSPMNIEGIFALTFLALLAMNNKNHRVAGDQGGNASPAAVLVILVALAFSGALSFPFLADDYIHIWNAHNANASALWAHFTIPETDHFFRPVVYCSYAFDALWAHLLPLAWRASNLAIHIANVVLVYLLCRELRFARRAALAGALIFALHGSRPEAVTWVAARFDLLATLFGTACLLALLKRANWWISCGFLALALMSKESAYVVPLLAAVLLAYVGRRGPEIWKPVLALGTTALIALAYRLWLLHGIGGYRNPVDGSAVVFHVSALSTLNALFVRLWASLLFPLNWTGGLTKAAAFLLVAALGAFAYLAIRGTDRRKFVLGFVLTFICALPVHQFLAIGMDLEKSRVLYFASFGLAILFAALFETPDWTTSTCAVALIAFQWVALQNNLQHWKEVGQLAGRICATEAQHPQRLAQRLPNVVDGVYFLKMGYPECLHFYDRKTAAGDTSVVTWDPQTRTLH